MCNKAVHVIHCTIHALKFYTAGYVIIFPEWLEEAFRPMDDRGIRVAQSCMSPVTHLLARSVGCKPRPLPHPLSLHHHFSCAVIFSSEFACFVPFMLFFCHDQAAIYTLSHALVLPLCGHALTFNFSFSTIDKTP